MAANPLVVTVLRQFVYCERRRFFSLRGIFSACFPLKSHAAKIKSKLQHYRRQTGRKDKFMEITYTRSGDYLLPDIRLSDLPDAQRHSVAMA